MERPGAKEVVLKAAQNLAAQGEGGRTPAATLKHLATSLGPIAPSGTDQARLQRGTVDAHDGDTEPEG